MSAAGRAFVDWFKHEYGYPPSDFDPDINFDGDELCEAFVAGWDLAMGARWETTSVPMLGIEGGEDLGPVHPGAPR